MDDDQFTSEFVSRGNHLTEPEREQAINYYKQNYSNYDLQTFLDGPFYDYYINGSSSNNQVDNKKAMDSDSDVESVSDFGSDESDEEINKDDLEIESEVDAMDKDIMKEPSFISGKFTDSIKKIFSTSVLKFIRKKSELSVYDAILKTSGLLELGFFDPNHIKRFPENDQRSTNWTYVLPSNDVINNSLWYIGRTVDTLSKDERANIIRRSILCVDGTELLKLTLSSKSKSITTVDFDYVPECKLQTEKDLLIGHLRVEQNSFFKSLDDYIYVASHGKMTFSDKLKMISPKTNALEYLHSQDDLKEFASLLNKIGATKMYNSSTHYTFIIPDDSSMKMFKTDKNAALDATQVSSFLHFVKGHLSTTVKPLFEFNELDNILHSLLGSTIKVTRTGDKYYLDESFVIRKNIKVKNGIVQVISPALNIDFKTLISPVTPMDHSIGKHKPKVVVLTLEPSIGAKPRKYQKEPKWHPEDNHKKLFYHDKDNIHRVYIAGKSKEKEKEKEGEKEKRKDKSHKYESSNIETRSAIFHLKKWVSLFKDDVQRDIKRRLFQFDINVFLKEGNTIVRIVDQFYGNEEDLERRLRNENFIYFNSDKVAKVLEDKKACPKFVNAISHLTLVQENALQKDQLDLNIPINGKLHVFLSWKNDIYTTLGDYFEKHYRPKSSTLNLSRDELLKLNQFDMKMDMIASYIFKNDDFSVLKNERFILIQFAVQLLQLISIELDNERIANVKKNRSEKIDKLLSGIDLSMNKNTSKTIKSDVVVKHVTVKYLIAKKIMAYIKEGVNDKSNIRTVNDQQRNMVLHVASTFFDKFNITNKKLRPDRTDFNTQMLCLQQLCISIIKIGCYLPLNWTSIKVENQKIFEKNIASIINDIKTMSNNMPTIATKYHL